MASSDALSYYACLLPGKFATAADRSRPTAAPALATQAHAQASAQAQDQDLDLDLAPTDFEVHVCCAAQAFARLARGVAASDAATAPSLERDLGPAPDALGLVRR